MQVKNMMEELVKDLVFEHWDSLNMPCSCEVCRADVLALALNTLPPRYVNLTRKQGCAYVKAEFFNIQSEANILQEIVRVAQIVKRRPSHN
ncbi:hypothetical protein GCM10010965_24230 [Caldalkalibacillus thermarum]|uniref:late competence development ComFB family protein n=1 Tax=Caldalkalibacillus thermarum TaxID=296745 RepID=UPI001666476F|nr:late competence development ComFB family protein [Caldalkalibacillus thermarum]GGK30517.1 hypothetical protein GCM10010965_24230 [Caldalkalibacillus thermarum]